MLRLTNPRFLPVLLCLPLAGAWLATPAHADPWGRGGHSGHYGRGDGYGGGRDSGRWGSGDRWSQGGHSGWSDRWGGHNAYSPYGYGRAPYYGAPAVGRAPAIDHYPQIYPAPSVRGNYLDRWQQGGPWSQAARSRGWQAQDHSDPRKPKPKPGPRGEGDGGDWR